MYTLPDHPEIEMAMRTGYPSWNQPVDVVCEDCGDIVDGDAYEDETYNCLCLSCLLRRHLKEV